MLDKPDEFLMDEGREARIVTRARRSRLPGHCAGAQRARRRCRILPANVELQEVQP
jgi:hypothetical protein